MKIAYDLASVMGGKRVTGLGNYAGQLFRALQRVGPRHEWVGIEQVTTDLTTPRRIWWDQVGLARAAKKIRPDILYVPAFSAPIQYSGKKVMTVHDLNGLLFPELFSRLSRWYWGTLLPYSAKTCAAIFVPSEVVANDVHQHLHIPEEKIHVTAEGVHPDIQFVDEVSRIRRVLDELKLQAPFLLSVGTREPRKNYARLIEAFARSERGNHELVIVGKQGWGTQDIEAVMQKFHLQNKVRFLDYVTTEQLCILYNSCTAFWLVSLYEGFGLPIVEAMKCGAPVVVSDRGSLPEVAGSAGMRIDPYTIEDMTHKMNTLYVDVVLRKRLQQASLDRAQLFTWEKTAAATLAVLEHL